MSVQAIGEPSAPHPESFATLEKAERHYAATEEGAWSPATLAPFVAAFAATPKIVVCPASGHFPLMTEPDAAAGVLVEFLSALR